MPVSSRWSDTSPQAMEVFVELHRRMTPGQKLTRVFELIDLVYGLSLADVRRCYPEASEREVFLRWVARRLHREWMLRVYGWQPSLEAPP